MQIVFVEKAKIVAGLLLFALVISTGWQIASCELSNIELKDDLKDLAAMNSARIGLEGPDSDEELRQAVIRRAASHDIRLAPEQILVRRSGTGERQKVFLATKYRARVAMPGLALIIHFTATSA